VIKRKQTFTEIDDKLNSKTSTL